MSVREKIDLTFARLREQIEDAVREEQLRDQLTGLPNGVALADALASLCAQVDMEFWVAFIEIDHFKRVNDEFGYENADSLLKVVSTKLATVRDYLPATCEAYRAHGDEFFLVGRLDDGVEPGMVSTALEHLGRTVNLLKVKAEGKPAPMCCTVTIGWLRSSVARERAASSGLSVRALMGMLERTVSAAKRRARGSVREFDDSVEKQDSYNVRSDCAMCQSAFSVDIPVEDPRQDDMYCPNCGQRVCRPPRRSPVMSGRFA